MLDKFYTLFISFMFGSLLSGVSVYKIYSWKVASVEIKQEQDRYDILLKEYQEYIKGTESSFVEYSKQLNDINNHKIELEKKQAEILEKKDKEIIETKKVINGIRQSLGAQKMDSVQLSVESKRLLSELTEIANGVSKVTPSTPTGGAVRDAHSTRENNAVPQFGQ